MAGSALILGAALLAEQIRIVVSFSQHHTTQDQTLLWYAGQELLHGHWHEPNFYGQAYNTVFEAFPAAMLHLVGVSWAVAMPLAAAGLVTAIWVVLAAGAYRAQQPIAALLALAIPLVVQLDYLLLFDAPRGVLAGDLAAAIGVAMAIGARRVVVKLGLLIALGGLGACWEFAALIIVAPMLVYVVLSSWEEIRGSARAILAWTGLAILVPLGWMVSSRAWYAAHPDYLTAPSVSTDPHLAILTKNFGHVGRYVAFFSPALFHNVGVAKVLIAIIMIGALGVSIVRGSWPLALSTLTLIGMVLAALSLNRSRDIHPGLYLAGSRLLLTLPLGLWLLAFLALKVSPARQGHDRRAVIWAPIIVGVSLASAFVVQATFTSRSQAAIVFDLSAHSGVAVKDSAKLLTTCSTLAKVSAASDAQLLVTQDQTLAYGCAALNGMATFIPSYDRREWVIADALHKPIERMMVTGIDCSSVPPSVARCVPKPEGAVLLITEPQTAASTLGRIAIPTLGS